jgi:hypothetical protein
VNNKKFKKPLAAQFRPAVAMLNTTAVVICNTTSERFISNVWSRVRRRVRVPLCRIINDYVMDRISRQLVE